MRIFVVLMVLLFPGLLFGQKTYSTKFLDASPKIDGIPNEVVWEKLPEAENFTIRYPNFGNESKAKTKVKLFYSSDAIYISAELHDEEPQKVSYSLSQRDDKGNGDWFSFIIDPWGNSVNAFEFMVTAAGVEIDALRGVNSKDIAWNAVWKSATAKRTFGWSVEMMIPFSAIRFPNKNIQEWRVNFGRQVRRRREESFWSPVDPSVFGEITQMGYLQGVKNIKSPLRLSFTPFLTGYIEKEGNEKWQPRITGGMDVKYGINDAFTLDVSLVPDFGQTISDKKVLNLTPFEVRFNENRSFFLEGTELFKIGGLFYSRRVGAEAHQLGSALSEAFGNQGGNEIVSIQNQAQLINATKISGRTQNGLGIGFFNAIERSSDLIFKDTNGVEKRVQAHPLSNYNVFVFSQNLKNNGQLSFINTNVLRSGKARDANVTGVLSSVYSKNGKYNLSGGVKVSSIFENGQADIGHALDVGVKKVGGQLQFGGSYSEKSDNYDPNDLGFLYVNNSRGLNGFLAWYTYKERKRLLRNQLKMEMNYEQLYRSNLFSNYWIRLEASGTFRNFLTAGMNLTFEPFGRVDHFESRVWGKEVRYQPSVRYGAYYSSDYSKRFALDMNGYWKEFFTGNQRDVSFSISPRVRVSDRFFLVWNSSFSYFFNDYGFVLGQDWGDEILIGDRNRWVVENSLKAELIFTKRMGMNVQLRHYWQQIQFTAFSVLGENSELTPVDYGCFDANGNSCENNRYDAFTIDLSYRWVFVPGSELNLVYKNNIFNSSSGGKMTYFSTFSSLFDQPQLNSISLKILVYLDARYFKRKKKNVN